MNILIFCHFGKNRSRYLADYLVEKGYQDVKHAGVMDPDHEKIQKEIDWADIIIYVSHHIHDDVLAEYRVENKREIILEVEDRPEIVLPDHRHLQDIEWSEFQKEYVYPALKEQLEKYLPFE
ncbi:MAG: hypothetical protein WC477_02165 [Patescibacteria group bacterium]